MQLSCSMSVTCPTNVSHPVHSTYYHSSLPLALFTGSMSRFPQGKALRKTPCWQISSVFVLPWSWYCSQHHKDKCCKYYIRCHYIINSMFLCTVVTVANIKAQGTVIQRNCLKRNLDITEICLEWNPKLQKRVLNGVSVERKTVFNETRHNKNPC